MSPFWFILFLHSRSVKFLADTYLKYIGWMLYDKVGEVRVACLNVLEPLYSDPDTAPHLELFTEKFKVSNQQVHGASFPCLEGAYPMHQVGPFDFQ